MNIMAPLLIALAVSAPPIAPTITASSAQAVVPHCQVLLIKDVDVSADDAGRLVDVSVAAGAAVQAGALVAKLDDRAAVLDKLAAELERDAAQARADDDIEVRYAVKSFELADAELAQDLEINQRAPGTVPTSEIRRKQLARHRADLQIDRSRLDLKVAQMTADVQNAAVQAAEEKIARRRLLAPFDGFVVQVYRQANEWVNAGEPVLRVVQMDRLHVDGFISGADYAVSEIANHPVTVEVELARGRKEQFTGRVVFVNPIVQAGNRYRVRAEVKNRQEAKQWLLNPGSTATMVIHLQ